MMLGVAEVARDATGHQAVPWLQPFASRPRCRRRLKLEEAYEEKLAEGRALPTEQAIEIILDRHSSPQTAASAIG